ncbi:MAG: thiolase family protein [Bacteroidetes bacterium]|nr:MAG: thiolase family protein [Bacteroidota bacterium]
MQEVYIVSAVRTPIGSFLGSLSALTATQLGAEAIKGALARAGVKPEDVEEVLMGNVVSAGLGQAPARQAAIYAGLPKEVSCTTINKVCASGMKAIMLGAQSIMLGLRDVVVAGGMESMSNIPHYLMKSRFGYKYGDTNLVDGLAFDGLTDIYDKQAMGVYADRTSEKYGFTRELQDEFAIQSYKRSAESTEKGIFKNEIVPVVIPQKKGDAITVGEDEEYKNVNFSKIPTLKAAFSPNGTVTAANASTINDGASATILMSKAKADALGIKPIARIVAFADAEQEPAWFTTTPVQAAKIALKRAGLQASDINLFEVNEAFACVSMAFAKEFEFGWDKMNILGGAVSLGHPLGSSGSRIVTTLTNALAHANQKIGMAAICNGGGGASAIIIERV